MAGTPLATAWVRIKADTGGFRRDTEREADRAGDSAGRTFGRSFGRSADKGAGKAGAFGTVIAIAAARTTLFGAAASSAAPAVLQLAGALAPAAGAALGLPAALAGAAAAMGTLKLATAGVGDAISEGFTGNADKAREALKKLSPEAAEFARSVIALKGPLNRLQDTTADQFFRRFNTQVGALAQAWLPILNRQVPILAGSMGGLAKQFAVAARQRPLLDGVRSVLGNTATAAKALEPAIKPAVAALGNLLSVGAPAIRQMALGFSDAATRAAAFVTQAYRSGRLSALLEAGKQALADLGGVLGNVGSAFASVMRAANAGGNSLLATFRELTGQVAAFLRSAQGSQALTAIFSTLSTIGAAIRTSLGAVLPAVGQSLAALGPTIARLATTAAQFVVALAPLLPSFSRLAATLLDAVIPALASLAGWLNRHQAVLKVVAAAVGGLYVAITLYSVGAKVAAAATTLWTTVTTIASTVTKIWTATTAALGVAMRFALGPIGLIITAVGLLVAGIVYAYKHHEGFRNLVQKVWQGIQAAALWAWEKVLKPVFNGLKQFITNVVGPALLWLWRNVFVPAWQGIQIAASFAWNNIIKPVLAGLKWWISNVTGPAVMFLWNNIFKPAWAGISWAVKTAWVGIQVALAAFRLYLTRWIIPIVLFLWRNVIQPSFRLMGAYIGFVWNNVIKPVFAAFRAYFTTVAAALRATWTNIIKPVFAALGGFISGTVAPAFRRGVDAIRTAWDKVRDAAKKPVTFVVNSVINPLIRGFNKVAGALGVKDRVAEIKGFATGGRIPGRPSGRDNRLAAGPGGLLKVATGEFITNARSTAANLPLIKAINAARGPVTFDDLDPHLDGRADGGIIGRIKSAASSVWDAITNPGKLLKAPLEAAVGRIPGAGTIRNLVGGMGRKLISGLMAWIGRTGGGVGGGSFSGGWQRMRTLIEATFPHLNLISGFRAGARTLSGNRSYHALGRAVDYPPSRALAQWIRARFGGSTKELITPFQEFNLLNGRPHKYTGAVWKQHNFAGGNAHVHWAAALGGLIGDRSGLNLPVQLFDRGGPWKSGTFGFNGSGRTEFVDPGYGGGRGGDTFNFHFHGPVGSQRELDTWLVRSMDRLKRERRLT